MTPVADPQAPNPKEQFRTFVMVLKNIFWVLTEDEPNAASEMAKGVIAAARTEYAVRLYTAYDIKLLEAIPWHEFKASEHQEIRTIGEREGELQDDFRRCLRTVQEKEEELV